VDDAFAGKLVNDPDSFFEKRFRCRLGRDTFNLLDGRFHLGQVLFVGFVGFGCLADAFFNGERFFHISFLYLPKSAQIYSKCHIISNEKAFHHMILILHILLGIFLFILALLAALLIFKTWFELRAQLDEPTKSLSAEILVCGRTIAIFAKSDLKTLTLMVGIIGRYLPVYHKIFGVPAPPRVKKATPAPQKKDKVKKKAQKRPLKVWIDLGQEVLRRLIRIPRFEKLAADLVIGLENPMTTGLVFGAYMALSAMTPLMHEIYIRPDFMKKRISGKIEFSGSIRLFRLLPIVILSGWTLLRTSRK